MAVPVNIGTSFDSDGDLSLEVDDNPACYVNATTAIYMYNALGEALREHLGALSESLGYEVHG